MTRKVPTNDKIADSYDLDPNDNRWRKRVILNDTEEVLRGSLQVVKTSITTVKKKIDTPEDSGDFFIANKTAESIVYVGGSNVTVASGYPLASEERISFSDMNLGNDNEIYGITSSGTVSVFAVVVYND